jgi:RNA polymerase Rpb2, domain 6
VQDAIVVNKAALDRGFGRCTVHHSYKAQLKRYINRTSDRIVSVANRTGRYRALGPDGLAEVGAPIGPGACTWTRTRGLDTSASAGLGAARCIPLRCCLTSVAASLHASVGAWAAASLWRTHRLQRGKALFRWHC